MGTFNDYMTAIVLYKYLDLIKKMKPKIPPQNPEVVRLRKEYKLTAKNTRLSAKNVFKVLKDYKANKFELDTSVIDGYRFNVVFVDQRFKQNIMALSYPPQFKYHLSDDEV